jgi:D-sedoheptulose 7-phosphate isomerase
MEEPVDIEEVFEREVAEHAELVLRASASLRAPFGRFAAAALRSVQSGHKLLLFGNGGSAADAQHLATELTVRYRINRRPIAAIALTTDTSALTAIGNDFGFDDLFARQVEALCAPGDVAIGISTSGNSENVIRGLQAARRCGAVTAGFGGGTGGRMVEHVDHALIVPSTTTARIQEIHIMLGHMLCGLLETAVAAPAGAVRTVGGAV